MTWPVGPRHFRWQQLHPELECHPDINRGEERLAAEVMLAAIQGQRVPTDVHARAVRTLCELAA